MREAGVGCAWVQDLSKRELLNLPKPLHGSGIHNRRKSRINSSVRRYKSTNFDLVQAGDRIAPQASAVPGLLHSFGVTLVS